MKKIKIRLNENEVYEIKLPEEIGVNELSMITARFNSLLKSFSRFNLIDEETPINETRDIVLNKEQSKQYTKERKQEWVILRNNRNLVVMILDAYYNNTKEAYQELLAQYNITALQKRSYMSNIQVVRLKEYHKIKPQEVGLRKWPTKTESIDTVRLGEYQRKIIGDGEENE